MYCKTCKKRNSCIKVCNKLNRFLRLKGNNLYSSSTIYRHELPTDPNLLDGIAMEAIGRLRGKRRKKSKKID